MICEKCHAALEEDALFCHVCGDQFAANRQKEKVNRAFLNTRNIIFKQTKSPIFMTVSIFLSVILAFGICGESEFFSGVLSCVFMAIAVVGAWSCYATKKYEALAGALRRASIFDAYLRVVHTVSAVLLSVLCAVSVIFALFMGAETGLSIANAEVSSVDIISAVVLLVAFAAIISIVLVFRSIYAKRRKFFLSLSETVRTCNYTVTKAPVKSSCVLGGFYFLQAIFSIVLALFMRGIVYRIFALLLLKLDLVEVVDITVTTLASGLVAWGISSFIIGGYLVFSAIWMHNVHKEEMQNKTELIEACAEFEKIEKSVKEIIAANKTDEDNSKCAELSVVEEITVEEAVVQLSGDETST